jgi:hypothetical protein
MNIGECVAPDRGGNTAKGGWLAALHVTTHRHHVRTLPGRLDGSIRALDIVLPGVFLGVMPADQTPSSST